MYLVDLSYSSFHLPRSRLHHVRIHFRQHGDHPRDCDHVFHVRLNVAFFQRSRSRHDHHRQSQRARREDGWRHDTSYSAKSNRGKMGAEDYQDVYGCFGCPLMLLWSFDGFHLRYEFLRKLYLYNLALVQRSAVSLCDHEFFSEFLLLRIEVAKI